MDVSDIGEFGLIARLQQMLGTPASDRVIVGPGDDAAVWRSSDGWTIATTDTMVAGVHFLADTRDWGAVGWKALASNVSDIAAMGGRPEFALVTLCLPKETALETVDEIYGGILECAEQYGVRIAGGDVVASPVLTITIALTGAAATNADGSPALLRRNAASEGDAIAVTGPLGGAAGGLRALRGGFASDMPRALIERHMRPRPRVAWGRAAVAAGVRCAIDVSDGLMQDLGHICEASALDAEVFVARLPLDESLLAVFPEEAVVMAATGGEEYELLLIAPDLLLQEAANRADGELTIIGRMLPRSRCVARLLGEDGREVELQSAGWDHLSRGS